MTRYLVSIRSTADRQRAAKLLQQAPFGTRVEFKASKRSLPQNSRFWAMLSDIAMQADHHGRKYTPENWRSIFMAALGKEQRFAPALDGEGFVPLGARSSDLSKQEMSDLMELMTSWSAERGITLHDDQPIQQAAE